MTSRPPAFMTCIEQNLYIILGPKDWTCWKISFFLADNQKVIFGYIETIRMSGIGNPPPLNISMDPNRQMEQIKQSVLQASLVS